MFLGIGIGLTARRGGGGGPIYLPTLAAAALAVYSVRKLIADYTGPLLTVCGAADSNTPASPLEVYPDVYGVADFTAAVAAFGSTFHVWRVHEQTGSGNVAEASTSTLRPRIVVANAWADAGQGFSYTATSQGLLIGTGLATSRQSVSIFSVTAQRGMQPSNTTFGLANTNNPATYLNLLSSDARIQGLGNAFIYSPRAGLLRPHVKALRSGSGNLKIDRNDHIHTGAAFTASASMVGGCIGGINTAGALAATYRSTFEDHFAHIVYPSQISDGDAATLKAALYAIFSIQNSYTAQLVCVGDSIMFGQGSSAGRGFPSRVEPHLTNAVVAISNPSAPGTTLGAISGSPTNYATMRESGLAKQLVYIQRGTNDLGADASLATMQGYVTNIASALSAYSKVVFGTVLPRTAGWSAGRETVRGDYNSWLLDPATQSSLNIVSIDRTAGGTVMNNPSDATRYGDGLHPTDLGYQDLADHEGPILNALLAA